MKLHTMALVEVAGNVVVVVVVVVAVVVITVADGIVVVAVGMASGGGLQHISGFARPKLLLYHPDCTGIQFPPDF